MGIVKLFLECKEVNLNSLNKFGEALLPCAAGSGYEGIVKLLRERKDPNPNSSSNYGQALLWAAARNG